MVSEPRRDLPVPLRVNLRRPDGTTTVEYAVNISSGGVCLHVKDTLSAGDRVHVEFTLPPSGPTIRADARVEWTSWQGAEGEERRFCETGVQFTGIEESVEQQLFAYARQPVDRRR
jgi:Tfp pilus assembly protein PilZ